MQKNTSIKELSYSELSALCEQLGLILGSGITVVEGFYIMLEESTTDDAKNLFSSIINELELGEQLSDVFVGAKVFPSYMTHMIKIGEVSGRLETVFKSLAHYYAREDSLRTTIKHSITYPVIMVGMMLLVIVVLLVNVMPTFGSVFEQLGSEITGFSKLLLDMGAVISNSFVVLLVILGAVAAAVLLSIFTPKGKELSAKFKENFFLTRNIVENIAVVRFAGGLSLMLSSGLDIDESLKMVKEMVTNSALNKKITSLQDAIDKGEPFSKALIENKIFVGVYARMIAVGFKTGQVDSVMESISKRYDEDITKRLENVISIIEPTIVAILSIVVGAILLSVMLPLMNIISQMG